jgi:flagellin
MTSIASNIAAERVLFHGAKINSDYERATDRLSGGRRVNNASDDAAGLFVAQRIKRSIKGMERAINNSSDGLGLISTVEASVNEIRNIVLRMRELAVQMANGVYTSVPDRNYAQSEINQLQMQIDMISENANFNGVKLLDGSFQNINIQSGDTADERMSVSFGDRTVTGLGINSVSVETQVDAKTAMVTLDGTLQTLSDDLSIAGAYANRLHHNINLLGSSKRLNEIAFGRIMDADMAVESTNLSKAQVLAQANAAMLAQSNNALSVVLKLFS